MVALKKTRLVAFMAVTLKGKFAIGLVEEDRPGYYPTEGYFASYGDALKKAMEMNEDLGLCDEEVLRIIATSIRSQNTKAVC